MPHLEPQYDRASVQSDEQGAYDRVLERQLALQYEDRTSEETIGPYFGILMHSPRLSDRLSDLGMFFRSRGETDNSFGHKDREWIDMTLGHELGCKGVIYSHLCDAVAVGVRPEAVKALREGRDADLAPDERQLTDYIRAVARGQVSGEQFRGIEQRFGTRGAVDYTGAITWLMMTMRNLQAFGFDDPTDAQIDQLLEDIVSGAVALPDPTARVAPLELVR
jgi:hypothetical protein